MVFNDFWDLRRKEFQRKGHRSGWNRWFAYIYIRRRTPARALGGPGCRLQNRWKNKGFRRNRILVPNPYKTKVVWGIQKVIHFYRTSKEKSTFSKNDVFLYIYIHEIEVASQKKMDWRQKSTQKALGGHQNGKRPPRLAGKGGFASGFYLTKTMVFGCFRLCGCWLGGPGHPETL